MKKIYLFVYTIGIGAVALGSYFLGRSDGKEKGFKEGAHEKWSRSSLKFFTNTLSEEQGLDLFVVDKNDPVGDDNVLHGWYLKDVLKDK